MSSNLKTVLFWAVLILLAGMLFVVVKSGAGKKEDTISLTEFVTKVQDKEVKDITIQGSDVHGEYVQNPTKGFKTKLPPNYPEIYTLLYNNKVTVNYDDASSSNWI